MKALPVYMEESPWMGILVSDASGYQRQVFDTFERDAELKSKYDAGRQLRIFKAARRQSLA